MIRTILFDFGNVVAFFDHRRALRALAPYTERSETELFAAFYDSDLENRYERGELTTDEFVALALQLGQLRCTTEQFLAGYVDIFTGNPRVAELVPRLKPRYRLGLASNTNAAHSTKYRQQFAETLRHFDFLGLSQEARARKPEPAFYAYIQQHVECALNECVFIDDVEKNIIAAEQFGWHGIVYHGETDLEMHLRELGVEV